MRTKILYIHHGVGIGGAPISLLNLIKKLDQEKYAIKIACLKDGEHVKLFRSQGINVEIINASTKYFIHAETGRIQWYYFPYYIIVFFIWLYTAFFAAPRYLKEQHADIVHLNSHVLSSWAFAAKKQGFKVILHNREAIAKGYFGVRKLILQYLIKNYTDQIVNISKDNRDRLGIDDKSSVVYNSVKIPSKYREPFDDINNIKVLYLGGTAKIKGFENIVEATKYLSTNVELIFCGSIEESSNRGFFQYVTSILERKSKSNFLKELKSNNRVKLVGLVKDVESYLNNCDILVTPFKISHFSRPAIEAFAHGKPVIGTDVIGMDEIIDHGINGLIVKNNKPKELATAINELSANIDYGIKLGLEGRKKAKELFSPEISTSKIENIYHEVTRIC